MFRSLFIGFLILSALASKGVGVQIDQNIQLSADILLQLYNAAAQADRLAEPAPASAVGVVRADAKRGGAAYEVLLRHAGQDGQFIWFVPADQTSGAFLQCGLAALTADCFSKGAVYAFGSDNSPPDCL